MNIETKFAIGDHVVPITRVRQLYWEPCEACGEKGEIPLLDGSTQRCTRCHGDKGKTRWLPEEDVWYVVEERAFTIRQLSVRVDRDGIKEERYMAWRDGGGTLYPVEKLFLSLDEAEDACRRLNNLQGWDGE